MKKTISVFLAVLVLLSLCACGSSRSAPMANSDSVAAGESYAYYPTEEFYDEAEAEIGGFGMLDEEAPDAAGSVSTLDPEKIIYSASVTVETTEYEATLERLAALVSEYGGFVESSYLNGSNYYNQSRGYSSTRSAGYTIRVPSNRFQEMMSSLSTLGNVPYSNTYTENITSQYYDVEARLTAYRTQETRLLEMMELAETVSDVIVIEDRLTELRYQIESLQTTLNNWDRRVSYSSIDLSVQEVRVYTPEAALSYGQQLKLALTNGLKSTGEFFKDLLVFLVESLPGLIILAILLFIVIRVVKKRRSKKRAKKEALRAAAEAPKPEE